MKGLKFKSLKIKIFAALGCVAVCAACFMAGYRATRPRAAPGPGPPAAAAAELGPRITGGTRMVYEYHYLNEGLVERAEEAPPYFLLNVDGGRLRELFLDWEVVSFTPERVVLRKDIAVRRDPRYVVGELNGYVAVFYTEEVNGTYVKEMLNMPVQTLPAADRARLAAGISVHGDEALMKILQDYGS
jgi:hypothetical protein